MVPIRNFCIIAHVDHGKSTLADRFLELTGTVSSRQLQAQMLDMMPLERERGITIKLTPVRMQYKSFVLNLIDTPGHVDFSYEVSRSLAAVEGAILLVDATQGVQAQTLANLHLARNLGLTIIPVINKIDLPQSDISAVKEQMVNLLDVAEQDILLASGKTGVGVIEIMDAIVSRVPAPSGDLLKPFRALIFDSLYDEYRGVIAYVRVIDGSLTQGQRIRFCATEAAGETLEVGYFAPHFVPQRHLGVGDIGYVVTGLKDLAKCRVGDTVTVEGATVVPLPGYKQVQPMVFASVYPSEGGKFEDLRKAMSKLKLNDASLSFEPERSQALGFGFRVGVLGLLHLEIMKERLRREFATEVTVTIPQVAYRVVLTNNEVLMARSPRATRPFARKAP